MRPKINPPRSNLAIAVLLVHLRRKKSAREQAESAADEATSPYEAPLVRFDALIELDGNNGNVKPGMSGDVKIYSRSRPLAMTIGQA
jgi:hypothetical protein